MTKKKETQLAFPKHVLGAIEELEGEKSDRSDVLQILTKPHWPAYSNYYEKMWESLLSIEREYGSANNNEWVYIFVADVIEAKKEAPFYLMSGSKRKALINEIKKHTNALKTLYEENGLNKNLISNDEQFFNGFHAYDDEGKVITENGRRPKVSVSDTLEFFLSVAEDEILETALKGKIVARQQANRFVKLLGHRNLSRYGTVLVSVVINAAFAIYEEEYTESDIVNLVNGREK